MELYWCLDAVCPVDPTGNLLSGFYIALMFSFSLSHAHNSICHGVITCLGPGCACAKENL